MCKASDESHARGGVRACMRHLKTRMPSMAADRGEETEDSDDDDGGVRLPGMAPVLRLLSRDLLTEACCMLDVKSLAEASAACRSLRDVCQGRYPWRLLCLREWGMTDKDGPPSKLGRNANGKNIGGASEEKGALLARSQGSSRRRNLSSNRFCPPGRARGVRRLHQRLGFRDSILGGDFRRLFPLIEEMPSGFDCSLLLRRGDLHAESEGVDREGGRDVVTGGFCVKGVVREVARSRGCDRRIPGVTGEEQGGREDEGEAGCDPTELVALQVEYRGGIGIGNRCVRADLSLPSTVLRERTSPGVRSHLAHQLATSPLAIFRWLLTKATLAAGAGIGGRARRTVGGSTASEPTPGLAAPSVSAADAAGAPGAAAAGAGGGVAQGFNQLGAFVEGAGGGGLGMAPAGTFASNGHGYPLGNRADGDGDASEGVERTVRAASMPVVWGSGGGGFGGVCRGRGFGLREESLPFPVCFPVALGGGVFDVTPRLVSYFEVTIGTPRSEHPHSIPDCIAVGLSKSGFPLRGKMPGWDSRSYGYHSDDGGAFHDAGSMLFKCGPSFGSGDVIGCGLDYSVGDDSADIFFTINGRFLGGAFHGVKGSFYPTVGIDSACPVRINLGAEPFAFDLAAALREGGQEAAAREAMAQLEPLTPKAAIAETPSKVATKGAPRTRAGDRQRRSPLPLPGIFRPFVGRPSVRASSSRVQVALSY